MNHRHTWTETNSPIPSERWACEECEARSDTCVVTDAGRGEHATGSMQVICESCLSYERSVLDDVAAALGHWQHQPRSLVPAIRYDRDRVGGSHTEADRRGVSHPGDVVEVLWSWAAMWEEASGEIATDVVTYLKGRTMWAATNPATSAWEDWRSEMRQMRHAARRLAGLLPQRKHGPCVHCNGQIVQDWADERWRPNADGLSDALRCTGCDLTWRDHSAWMYTNGHTLPLLPEVAPEALVTIEDAWLIFREVPKPTWRKWRERDDMRAEALRAWAARVAAGEIGPEPEPQRMAIRSWDVRGAPMYRLGDLAAHAEKRRADGRTRRRTAVA